MTIFHRSKTHGNFHLMVPGTHEFPVRFFEAKYVLTAEPLPQTFVSGGEDVYKRQRIKSKSSTSAASRRMPSMSNSSTQKRMVS